MVLEATMIVVDNSEASRNGDYLYGLRHCEHAHLLT